MKTKWGAKVVHSAAYKPSTQGAVERFNSTLKTLLFSQMAKFGSKRWVDILQPSVDNHNNTKHAVAKHTPVQILKNPELRSEVAQNIRDTAAARQAPTDSKEKELSVGDSVRVALSTRAMVRKNGLFAKSAGKQHWSDRIYTISSISRPQQVFQRKQYTLRYKSRTFAKRYYASQLMRIDPERLIKNDLELKDRPAYDEKFNPERHLRVDLPARKAAKPEPQPEPPTLAQSRPRREIRKPQRYGDFA